MSYRAIYTYAWDIAEVGGSAFVAEAKAVGLDTVTFAGSYHAGKFLRPKGKGGKVYFPEDGTAYFRVTPERYREIKPLENGLVKKGDTLKAVCEADIAVNAWMVLLHNTRLGTAHPGSTVENAFGDRYIYSLCPSAPESREYAVALCKDVTESYPVIGLCLETPGFLPYQHGFHHEFALLKQNRWLDAQLGLCFCDHCLRGAAQNGIDAAGLKKQVASAVETYLGGEIDLPDDMADAVWLADVLGEMGAYLRYRCETVTSLVAEIRAAVRKDAAVAVIPSVARPTAGASVRGNRPRGARQERRCHRGLLLPAERRACSSRHLRCAAKNRWRWKAPRHSASGVAGPPEQVQRGGRSDGASRCRHP